MINLLKLSTQEINDVVTYCASIKNIAEAIIEKDLWNCYFLDFLFNRSKYKDYFVFKGGTSLSKGFNLIDRYSEDLDVVLDSSILGIDLDKKLDELKTRNQQNNFVELIENESIDFIKNNIIPEIKEKCEMEIGKELKINLVKNDLAFYIEYPHTSGYTYISPVIKIEMSSLSQLVPSEERIITAYINDVVASEYKYSFYVKCLRPERTFWEKVLILHQESNRVEGQLKDRYSRHYYDVYKIYKSGLWDEIINKKYLLDEVRKFTITFYNRKWAKFNEAVPGHFKLIPESKYLELLKDDYIKMREMIFSNCPSFETIIKTLEELENKINNI